MRPPSPRLSVIALVPLLLASACGIDDSETVLVQQVGHFEIEVPADWTVGLPPTIANPIAITDGELGVPVLTNAQSPSSIAFAIFYRRAEAALDLQSLAEQHLSGTRGEVSDLERAESGSLVSYTATASGEWGVGTDYANLVAVIGSTDREHDAWLLSCLGTAPAEESGDLMEQVVEECRPVFESFVVLPMENTSFQLLGIGPLPSPQASPFMTATPLSTPWPIATSVDPSRRSGAWERPDESSAVPVDEAKAMLSQIDGIGEVIEAAEAVDIQRLLSLAEPGTIDCATTGRSTPQECDGQPTAVLPSVTHAIGIDVQRPIATMERWLEEYFGGHTLALTFAAREGTLPEGVGGRYYLVFKSMNPSPDEEHYDKLTLIISPDSDHPIESFSFGLPRRNGLEWIQEFYSDSQILITPESVETWRGARGRLRSIAPWRDDHAERPDDPARDARAAVRRLRLERVQASNSQPC